MRSRRPFRDIPLFTKITLVYVTAMLLPALLMLGYSIRGMLDTSHRELARRAQSIAGDTALGVEDALETARNVTAQLSFNQVLQNFLRRRYVQSLASMEYYRDIVRSIMVYARDLQTDTLAYVRVFMSNPTIPESWEFFFSHARLSRYPWYQAFAPEAEGLWVHPERSGLPTDLLEYADEPVVAYARRMYTPYGAYLGTVVAAARVGALRAVLDAAATTPGAASHLLDSATGNVVTASAGAAAQPAGAGGGRIVVRLAVMEGRFTLVTTLDAAMARRAILLQALQIFGGILAGLGILEIVTLLYLRHLGRRFDRMRAIMDRVAEGEFDIRVPQDARDEIGLIAQDFNVLIGKINDLVVESIRKETAQRDAQLMALQFQINPHFIYNTLDSFRMKLVMAEQYEVAEGLAHFGNMLRYNMDTQTMFTTLGEEVEHVRQYLAVQAVRYEDRPRLTINLDRRDLDLRTLKFVLQPVVENCVSHGLPDDGTPLEMVIRGERRGATFEIRVADDGKGISATRLDEVRASLAGTPDHAIRSGGPGIGLINIHARLSLYFGQDYGLDIASCEGQGTSVTLRFPVAEAVAT
jgi:HAMP domain-containing protein